MRIQRSSVIGRLGWTPGRLAVGLLATTVTASVGCSQPRSYLDTTVMQQQTRDAERFWGPDGLVGQAPLAYQVPDAVGTQTPALLAQNGAYAGQELFPVTYRSVRLPRSQPAPAGGSDIAVVAAQPSPNRLPEPVQTVAYEPAVAAPANENESTSAAKRITHVTGRPRDDGLMMTSLEQSESLRPLPPDSSEPTPSPRTEANSVAEPDELPPLPPGSE